MEILFMGDDNVKKLGARFQDGFLPMGEDVDAAAITYQTLDEIPICVPEGDKEGKDWFNPNADLHRVRVFPVTDTRIKKNLDDFNTLSSKAQKNRLSAQHDKPGDVEKSLEREKKELESGKRTEPGDLGTLRNPKTDEEIRRIQAMNYGYNLEVDDDTKLLVPKSPDSIYEMCRFASKGVDGGTPLLVYKKGGHKILDKQCQDNKGAFYNTLLGVELTNEEILELMTLLEIPKGDGCIDPNGDNKKYLSVTNKLSVEDVDGKLTKAILKSDKFTPERAKQIVAALQKAFEGARTDKGLKDGQKTMIWKILLGQIPATLAGIVG
ncbi:MAG: hypothetical protein U1D33_03900, partial [bacterium]|nr:hypothetical protein [bacterium]